MFFHLNAILLIRAAKHQLDSTPFNRQCHGQDQEAGKVVQQQREKHRVVLLVGRERHSDGYRMSSASKRPTKKLAGVDRRGLSVRTCLVGEEECAGPAADAGGRGIRVERERESAGE